MIIRVIEIAFYDRYEFSVAIAYARLARPVMATLTTTIKTAIERIKTDFLPAHEHDSCETVKL